MNNTINDQITETASSTQEAVRSTAGLAEALRAVLLLVDDGDLVRNTDGDGDMMTFLRQGMKITSALKKAQEALASANKKLTDCGRERASQSE